MTAPISTECVASLFEALGNKWSAEVVRLASALRDPDSADGAMCYDRECTGPHYGFISANSAGTNSRGRHNYGRKLTKQQRARVARPLPPRKGKSK